MHIDVQTDPSMFKLIHRCSNYVYYCSNPFIDPHVHVLMPKSIYWRPDSSCGAQIVSWNPFIDVGNSGRRTSHLPPKIADLAMNEFELTIPMLDTDGRVWTLMDRFGHQCI